MEEEPKQPTLLGKIGTAALLAAIGAVAVYGFAHVTISPIHPDQKTPKGHFDARCSLCHPVSSTAKLVQE